MALLSKEEERIQAEKMTYKKILLLLSMKNEILLIDNKYLDGINNLEFLIKNDIEEEIIENTFIELLIMMELDKRLDKILGKLKLNINYLIQMAIRYICMVDPKSVKYYDTLNEILGVTRIEEYEEKDGNILIGNVSREFQINRIFQYGKINRWKEILKYSTVFSGEQMYNCHGFNTLFYSEFPQGNIVTGNLSGRFKDIRFSHTWIEDQNMVYVPNLNYSATVSDYYCLFDPKDCVIIPYSKVNEDRIMRMRMQQNVDLYEYLIDPDKVMGRLK